jgi:hypothetical protein
VIANGGLSPQFEHSLLITELGVKILIVWDNMESSGALYLGDFMISFVPISKFGGGTPLSIKNIYRHVAVFLIL